MPYHYTDRGEKIENPAISQNIAYTTDGFLLPCCWCDAVSTRKDFENLGFYDISLLLSKNNSVEEILNKEPWKKFINIIMKTPKSAPRCCKEKCGIYDG
jgi:hypothetical protein